MAFSIHLDKLNGFDEDVEAAFGSDDLKEMADAMVNAEESDASNSAGEPDETSSDEEMA